MSPRRRRARIPAMLEAVIQSLEQQQFHNATGAARALRAFAELAAVEVPGRGAFAADNPDLYKAIEAIADIHLGFREPRREFSKATGMVRDVELRGRVTESATDMQSISY